MPEFADAARVLGLKTNSAISYLDQVERGLPVASVERVAACVAPGDRAFKYRLVPKASLARSKTQARLSAPQSVVIGRVAAVWAMARRIWKSDEAARDFLARAHPLLAGRKPLDLVLDNEIGAELVKSVLGQLDAGTAV